MTLFEASTRYWNFQKEENNPIRCLSLVLKDRELQNLLLACYVGSDPLCTLIKNNYEAIYRFLDEYSWQSLYKRFNPAIEHLDGFYATLLSMPRLLMPGGWDSEKKKMTKPRTTTSAPATPNTSQTKKNIDKKQRKTGDKKEKKQTENSKKKDKEKNRDKASKKRKSESDVEISREQPKKRARTAATKAKKKIEEQAEKKSKQ
jgi:hypothetical protein